MTPATRAGAGARIVVVAQAFKGSIAVGDTARALSEGCARVTHHILTVLASDGGDGLMDALAGGLVRRTEFTAAGPLGEPVRQVVGWLDSETAVVESRLWCGLTLIPPRERDPLAASTRGVGEVVAQLVSAGARTVLVGLGGSASVDGGTGFARAFGWRFQDAAAVDLAEGGGRLSDLASIVPARPPVARLVGLADVNNPLLGSSGAMVYAPQKGATVEQSVALGAALGRLVAVLERERPRARADAAAVGAGAAGGLGFGLLHFGAASLRSGAEWMLERAGFDAALAEADLVVTGEGRFDATSLSGKLVGEVLRRARAAGVPVALVAPSASGVPDGVTLESGGGPWGPRELARAAERAVRRALRLPPA